MTINRIRKKHLEELKELLAHLYDMASAEDLFTSARRRVCAQPRPAITIEDVKLIVAVLHARIFGFCIPGFSGTTEIRIHSGMFSLRKKAGQIERLARIR